MLFKNYLDIIGKVVFNYCDKYLLPALFEGENHSMCFGRYNAFSTTNCFSEKKRKAKEKVYLSAVKLTNFSSSNVDVKLGDRIAQIMFVKPVPVFFKEVEDFNDNTVRRTRGFGSTGK